MLKIKIIALGKFKESAYRDLERLYLKRLSPFAKVKLVELPEVGYKAGQDLDKIKFKKAKSVAKHLSDDAVVILLEEKGMVRNSVDFARFLERLGGLRQEITFVLGIGIGLHESLRPLSNYTISLSPLTFPHNMARIILEE